MSAFGQQGPEPLQTPHAAHPALQEHSQDWFLLTFEVVFTAVINISVQLCHLYMNNESSAKHCYLLGL